jgi:cytoskeletal protein CcmA (bactofilin family)
MRKEQIIGITGNETIIGAGVRVKGNLTSEHDMIIDGMLVGNVKTKGAITVGVNSIIKGNLVGRDITVSGQLEGDIKASNLAAIGETGRVRGNIACSEIAIASGAIFLGTNVMTMVGPAQPLGAEEEPASSQDEA